MRKVNIRVVPKFDSVLLSLNRFLYVLKPSDDSIKVSDLGTSGSGFSSYRVISKIEREGT